jgi:hypothetical protein
LDNSSVTTGGAPFSCWPTAWIDSMTSRILTDLR